MNSTIRILVVEDEAILAEDLRESLERQSYRVIGTVDNAADARASVRSEKPDIVMMDIHLAGNEDGISVATSLRDELDIPVIFLTAHSDHATLQRAKRASPYGYLVKPFEDQELRASIETAFYRHQSDAQLRKMERWLRTTLHSIGDGVITVDLDRRITFINPVAEEITGWSRQAAIGRPYQEVFSLRNAHNQRVQDPIAPVIIDGESLQFDESYQIDTKDGRRRRIDDSVAPIRDAEGIVTGAIIVFRDATDKWELDRLRRESESRMQEAQRLESLGVLAAGIAHDFNNLLAIIMGHAELLNDRKDYSEDERGFLAQIQTAGKRAAHLCDQMLSYADSDNVERKPIDLHTILAQTAQLLPARMPPGIKVRQALGAPSALVYGHAGRLQQVFTNLLFNGIEAMGDGPGSLEIETRLCATLPENLRIKPPKDATADQWLCISIEDEGHGMRETTLQRIFDPFFSTKFTGRGLGLSIVFNVLRLHGGALAIQTEFEVGTRFEVYLPLCTGPLAAPEAALPENDRPLFKSGRALIIDDETSVRSVLRGHLQHNGFKTHDTADIDEALRVVQTHDDLSVIFLDLTMPNITGIEVLRRIRLIHRRVPVVFVSGFSEEAVAEVLAADDHTWFMQKPFARTELTSILMRVLG